MGLRCLAIQYNFNNTYVCSDVLLCCDAKLSIRSIVMHSRSWTPLWEGSRPELQASTKHRRYVSLSQPRCLRSSSIQGVRYVMNRKLHIFAIMFQHAVRKLILHISTMSIKRASRSSYVGEILAFEQIECHGQGSIEYQTLVLRREEIWKAWSGKWRPMINQGLPYLQQSGGKIA